MSTLVFMLVLLTGSVFAQNMTLGDFPRPFAVARSYNNVALVVGETATGEDTLALTSMVSEIATKVSPDSAMPTPMVANELTDYPNWNIISVGGPCVNSVSASFLGVPYGTCGEASGIAPDTATVDLKKNGENWALIVAGWGGMDTRRAGVVMANFRSAIVRGKIYGMDKIVVTGTGLEIREITIDNLQTEETNSTENK